MKFSKLPKKHQKLISKFFNEIGIQGLLNFCNYKLMDKAPIPDTYYSYSVTIDDKWFMIGIDYEENLIYMHNHKITFKQMKIK